MGFEYHLPNGLLPSIRVDGKDIGWKPVLDKDGMLVLTKVNYKNEAEKRH